EVNANWKLWVENAHECYHCPAIHKSTFSQTWNVAEEAYEFLCDSNLIAQFASRVEGGGADDDKLRQLYIWPSSFVSIDGALAVGGTVTPITPDSSRLKTFAFVRRRATAETI